MFFWSLRHLFVLSIFAITIGFYVETSANSTAESPLDSALRGLDFISAGTGDLDSISSSWDDLSFSIGYLLDGDSILEVMGYVDALDAHTAEFIRFALSQGAGNGRAVREVLGGDLDAAQFEGVQFEESVRASIQILIELGSASPEDRVELLNDLCKLAPDAEATAQALRDFLLSQYILDSTSDVLTPKWSEVAVNLLSTIDLNELQTFAGALKADKESLDARLETMDTHTRLILAETFVESGALNKASHLFLKIETEGIDSSEHMRFIDCVNAYAMAQVKRNNLQESRVAFGLLVVGYPNTMTSVYAQEHLNHLGQFAD
jgi:hypothetical protein